MYMGRKGCAGGAGYRFIRRRCDRVRQSVLPGRRVHRLRGPGGMDEEYDGKQALCGHLEDEADISEAGACDVPVTASGYERQIAEVCAGTAYNAHFADLHDACRGS